jgi:glycerol-3-phosphate dehydrogenase (NAD(P)+)
MPIPVGVLGAGSFGTCLALLCARKHSVTIWARNGEIADAINRDHRNPRYLTHAVLPDNVRATCSLEEALADRELVICAVPSHGVRDVMRRASEFFPEEAILVSTVKGIESGTWMRMDQVFEDVPACISHQVAWRGGADSGSGARNRRSAPEADAISVQESLSCPWFRCYSATDVIRVELGGAPWASSSAASSTRSSRA